MQWGVGETESGQKKQKKKTEKERRTEGQKRDKEEKTRKREGNGEQGGRVFSCFDYLFAPFSQLHVRDAAILANQWPIKILKQVGTPAHPDYRIRRLGGVCGGDRPRKLIIFAPMCASL